MTHPDIPIDADKDTKHSSDDISTPIDKLENEAVLDSDETETEFLDDPPLFQFLTGIKQDLKARLPLYMDDWSRPKKISTVVNSIVFVFIVQLIPALIFAELMDRETEGNLATAEVYVLWETVLMHEAFRLFLPCSINQKLFVYITNAYSAFYCTAYCQVVSWG